LAVGVESEESVSRSIDPVVKVGALEKRFVAALGRVDMEVLASKRGCLLAYGRGNLKLPTYRSIVA